MSQEHPPLSVQACAQLTYLLPKLSSALTDKLEVLGEINGVLAAEGLTWADLAAALADPLCGEDWLSAQVLALVDYIEQEASLSPKAASFLTELRLRAAEQETIYLTPRQSMWLRGLHKQAEHERQRFDQQHLH